MGRGPVPSISDPQLAWGRGVAARLEPVPGERILDIGCGTGRLTAEIAQAPGVIVVGLDASAAMLAEAAAGRRRDELDARERQGAPVYVRGDGAALPFTPAFDAVFSNATFHWVPDHDRLFRSIHEVLNPGGRLVAQCGGAGNLRRALRPRPRDAWHPRCTPRFSRVGRTRGVSKESMRPVRRLEAAGFVDIDVSLTAAPTRFDAPDRFAEFIAAVCLRHELDRLPEDMRDPFIGQLTSLGGRGRSAVDARLLAPQHLGPEARCRDSVVRDARRPSIRCAGTSSCGGPPISRAAGSPRFLLALALLIWTLAGGADAVRLAAAGALFVVFGGLVVWHARVEERAAWHEALRVACEHAAARIDRRWNDLPPGDPPAGLDLAHHPYALDLDLFGRASLFQWLGPRRRRPARAACPNGS